MAKATPKMMKLAMTVSLSPNSSPARRTPVGTPLLTPVKGTPPDARPSGGLGAGSDPSAVPQAGERDLGSLREFYLTQ